MWTEEELTAETEWSRTFSKRDGSGMYFHSKFIDGEASITLSELAKRWPAWTEIERHDFCSAFSCGEWPESAEIFRFLSSDESEIIRSTIALRFAMSLDADEAYPILRAWASEVKIGSRGNYIQAIAVTEHPKALEALWLEFYELCAHPSLMDDSDWLNDIAMDLVWCIQYLVELGVSTGELRPTVSKLKSHPCQGIRRHVHRWLGELFDKADSD